MKQDSRKLVRAPDVPTAEFGDELAVMDLNLGSYIAFNRTAADVWKLLAEPRTLDELCETLAPRYRGEAGQRRSDVEELLAELQRMGLVEHVG